MADDRHDQAVGVIVERLIADAALRAIEGEHIGREDYPGIGEYHWRRIVSEALAECHDTIKRGGPGYGSAYDYLARRAQGQEATP